MACFFYTGRMVFVAVFVCIQIGIGSAITFNVQPEKFYEYKHTNLLIAKFSCKMDPNDTSVTNVLSLELRRDGKTIVSVDRMNDFKVKDARFQAKGYLSQDDVNENNLEIELWYPTARDSGEYGCYLVYFDNQSKLRYHHQHKNFTVESLNPALQGLQAKLQEIELRNKVREANLDRLREQASMVVGFRADFSTGSKVYPKKIIYFKSLAMSVEPESVIQANVTPHAAAAKVMNKCVALIVPGNLQGKMRKLFLKSKRRSRYNNPPNAPYYQKPPGGNYKYAPLNVSTLYASVGLVPPSSAIAAGDLQAKMRKLFLKSKRRLRYFDAPEYNNGNYQNAPYNVFTPNASAGFDPSTSVFTAAWSGIYVFHLTLQLQCKKCIMKASIEEVDDPDKVIQFFAGCKYMYDQSMVSAMTGLKEGAKVRVRLDLINHKKTLVANKYSQFSGYLMMPYKFK